MRKICSKFFSAFLILFLLLGSCAKKDDDTATSMANPFSGEQWHLKNSGQGGATVGEDINVTPVWNSGVKGAGIVVALIDDGLEIAHEDLSANISTTVASYNYVTGTADPTLPGSTHGTAVAGLIASKEDNYVGVKGVAPNAKLVGFNLIVRSDLVASDSDVGAVLMREASSIFIYNNSWGFQDGFGHFDTGVGSQWKNGIETGLANGRGGKGSIYIWAGGNGGQLDIDNSNYDGYANYSGVIAVCATGPDGQRSFYSEDGANLLVCAPSSGYLGSVYTGVTTTDLSGNSGYNSSSSYDDLSDKNYTNAFGGTSAAAPIVAGVVALMLEKNPELGWRDVRYILATTARQNDVYDSGWATNGSGHPIHHSYGFGVVDAQEAVSAAASWVNLGTLITYQSPVAGAQLVNSAISDNPTPASATTSTINVAGSGVVQIEFVEISFTSDHANWGDLEIILKRTSGGYSTTATLAETHFCFHKTTGTVQSCSVTSGSSWNFGTTRFLGESADGNWTLEVYDKRTGNSGNFTSWRLKFYGS